MATTEEPAAVDSYFESMAKRAISMNIPTDAATYFEDDPSHAIEAGKKYGIKCCRLKRRDEFCRISTGSAQTSARRRRLVIPRPP